MQLTAEQKRLQRKNRWIRNRELWIWTVIFLLWWAVFFLAPIYGIIYSFFDYTPGRTLTMDKFVGLKHFASFFTSKDAIKIIRNTLVISGLNLTIGHLAPIVLALQLDELRQGIFKKTVQTISYLPYFVSWVVVASLVITLLNSEGVVNEVLMKLGITSSPIPFLTEGKYFWTLITCVNILHSSDNRHAVYSVHRQSAEPRL